MLDLAHAYYAGRTPIDDVVFCTATCKPLFVLDSETWPWPRHDRGIVRAPCPSLVIMDGQSVKTAERGGARGFDGHKRVTGRKRHILVPCAW